MAVIGSAEVLIRPSFKGMQSSAKKAGVGAGTAAGASLTSRMGDALASCGKKVAKAGAVGVGAAIGAGIVGGVRSAMGQQASELVLSGLYNDANLAKETMKGLNEVAKQSPLGGNAFRKGAESLAYAGVQGDAAVKTLENVGKTIVGAGGTAEQMDQFTNGLLNGVNRGKFSLNELNQISKAGVPIFSSLAENMGVSMEEVSKMASEGKIGLEDVMDVLESADTTAFQQSLRAGDEAQKSFSNTAKTLWNNITETLGEHLQPALAWATDKFQELAEKVGPKLNDFLTTAASRIKDFIQEWKDGEGAGGRFRDIVERVGDALKSAFDYVKDTVVPALQNAANWLKENENWLVPIAAGIGAIVAAWKTYQITMGIVRGVTAAFTAAQAALNVVLNMNPIGLVVLAIVGLVAAFVTAYKKSETFRKIVDAAWNGIKKAARAVWNFLKTKVFEPLVDWVKTTWERFQSMKDRVTGAWDSVKAGLKAGWDWIKTNIFQRFTDGVTALRDNFQARVDRVKEIWDGVKQSFKAVWDWVKTNVFDRFTKGLDNLKDNVKKGVNFIGDAWKNVANKFRNPINWVLDKVWNKGIAKAFNNAAGALKLKIKLPVEARIPAFAKGGLHKGGWALVGEEGPELVNFSNPGRVYTADQTAQALAGAQGGMGDGQKSKAWYSRAWDATKDAAGAVTGWVRGGLAKAAELLLAPIRQVIAPTVKQWGTVGDFAGGAMTFAVDKVVDWIRGKDELQAPGAGDWRRPSRGPVTSRYGPRWGAFHAGIDIAGGGPTFAAAAGRVLRTGWNILAGRTGIGILLQHAKDLFTYYGHNPSMAAVRVKPGDMVTAGQRIGAQGATGNVTGVHLHFELHEGGAGRAVDPDRLGLFDRGGLLKPGMLAYHSSRMSKPDAVLTARQWDDIHRLATAGGGGDTYNVSLEVDLDDVGDVQRLVHTFRELPRRARQRVGVR